MVLEILYILYEDEALEIGKTYGIGQLRMDDVYFALKGETVLSAVVSPYADGSSGLHLKELPALVFQLSALANPVRDVVAEPDNHSFVGVHGALEEVGGVRHGEGIIFGGGALALQDRLMVTHQIGQ